MVQAFATSYSVHGQAYNQIRNALRARTGREIDLCIYEQKRVSNSMIMQSSESVIYIARGLRIMIWVC